MPNPVKDPEVEKAERVTALFINRFHITIAPDVTRIAFGEAVVGTDATYRAAVVMRTNDAAALADHLTQALSKLGYATGHAEGTSQATGTSGDGNSNA